jgi:uncharacterized membrane protein
MSTTVQSETDTSHDEPVNARSSPAPSVEPAQPLSSGEQITALVHLYRAEVSRSVRWRTRLDVTTNWAVLTTGAGMTFALGDPEPQRHVVILLSSLLVAYFLVIEARRYRHYDLWQRRVTLLEGSFYGPLLDPASAPVDPAWRATLAGSLREPRYQVSLLQAMGWRLQRNYLWLFLANAVIWLVKIDLHPTPSMSITEFVARAAVGPIPGWLVLVFGLLFNGALLVVAVTSGRRSAIAGPMGC